MIRGGRSAASILALVVAIATPAAACAAAGPLELVSAGAPGSGGNGTLDACDVSIQCLDFEASATGSRAFFSTSERLAGTDLDDMKDVYERSGGVTTQVSTGVSGGNGNFDATLQAISSDGTRAVFGTYEPLTRDDLDLTSDVYDRASEVRLVSTGAASSNLQLDVCEPGGATAIACYGLATAAAGSPVFFTTPESLTFDDLDVGCFAAPARCADVYRRSGEQTTLVSTGTSGGDGATLLAVSRDGGRAFFSTRAALTPDDTDTVLDLYERAGTSLKLVSTGTAAGAPAADAVNDIRVSSDGSRVVFATAERLVAADTDASVDLYDRTGSATTLISTGSAGGNGPYDACGRYNRCPGSAVSQDGTRVAFETADPLVAADTDSETDVYERSNGTTRLVSEDGGEGGPAILDDISANGSHVVFSTAARLDPADTDSAVDVYERVGGVTKLVSTGSQNGNGSLGATFEGMSAGGSRIVFSTVESLLGDDADETFDLYVRAGDATGLVSGGTAEEGAFFLDMSEDGKRVFFGTAERLAAGDTDGAIDVYGADLSGLQAPPEDPPPVDPPPVDPPPGDPPPGNGGGGAQPGPQPGGGAGTSGHGAAPARGVLAGAFGTRLKASGTGVVGLALRCTGQGSCRGRILIEAQSRGRRAAVVGRKTFTLAAGRRGTIRVKLSRKGRTTLRLAKRLKANVVVQTLDGGGALASSSLRAVTIRAAKQRR